MEERIDIRDSGPDELTALDALYRDAFPSEDLLPLVRELLLLVPPVLSLAAAAAGTPVGHVAFTTCGVTGGPGRVALLAPLAVAGTWQRRGLGRALVAAGLQLLAQAGVQQVFVLGDPAYYRRLGFAPETGVEPPYALPPAWRGAWQSLQLGEAGLPPRGRLIVPPPWQRPELWSP